MKFSNALLVLFFLFILPGCIGYSHESAEYKDMTINFKTKGDALESIGKPLKVESEDDYETWYYLLDRNTTWYSLQQSNGNVTAPIPKSALPPVTGSTTWVMLIIPIPWTTMYDENLKLLFKGEDLMSVSKRVTKRTAFWCGFTVNHGLLIPIPWCSYR